ncbi:MAG: hypothetical protein AAF616_02255 [Bacteroidota bacterium]
MSAVIPDYIGSRLSVFEDDVDEDQLSTSGSEKESENNGELKPQITTDIKGRKEKKMVRKGTKKKKNGVKKLPINPNAGKGENTLEQGTFDTPEIPTLEAIEPLKTTQELNETVNPVAGLKEIPSRKKKMVKRSPKKKSADTKSVITPTLKPELSTPPSEEQEALGVVNLQSTEKPKEKRIVKTSDSPAKKNIEDLSTQPRQTLSAAEERQAYVQNIREETKAFLSRLAEERKQRQQEYETFRMKLRNDLSRS